MVSFVVARVPFYFTLSLDTFDEAGRLVNPAGLREQIEHARSQGAEGVISDLWWSTVEQAPGVYDFSGYQDLAALVQSLGLKLQFTISFHGCNEGGSSCKFGLPSWVHASSDDIFFRSEGGRVSREYISIFADEEPVLGGRTPLQAYSEFLEKFNQAFWKYLGVTVGQVQIGLGPSGQLRYPSYSYSNFCGVGEFMAADKYAKKKLAAHFEKIGKPSLAAMTNLIANKATENSWDAAFFRTLTISGEQCRIMGYLKIDCGFNGITKEECHAKGCCFDARESEKYCYKSGEIDTSKSQGHVSETHEGEFGLAFTQFYSEELIAHADRVLAIAKEQLGFIRIGAKLSAVHWTAGSINRAPEMSAGYLVSTTFNFYERLMPVLAKHTTILSISGVEMQNHMKAEACWSRGADLLHEVKSLALSGHVEIMGENAWERSDDFALQHIAANSSGFRFFNFLRLANSFQGTAYVQSQIKSLVDKLDTIASAENSYDKSAERTGSKHFIECDCENEERNRLLHLVK